MTQKQVKFGKGKRSRKVKEIQEDYSADDYEFRRPMLPCLDDVGRMAAESSRARLISQFVNKYDTRSPREFASNYYEPRRYGEGCDCSVTSHSMTAEFPVPKLQPVIPAFPSIVQSEWYPYGGPPSPPSSETDITINKEYNCCCRNCDESICPKYYYIAEEPGKIRNNIMTFCDRWTMTRKLNDVASGTPSPSMIKFNDRYLPGHATSMVAVRDDSLDKKQLEEMYARRFRAPILKKSLCNSPVFLEECSRKPMMPGNYQDEVLRDDNASRSKSLKCFFRYDKDTCELHSDSMSMARKNIYNEGISDIVADRYRSPHQDYSRTSVSSKFNLSDNFIPYSHKSASKYHTGCKHPNSPKKFVVDEGRAEPRGPTGPRPKVICKTFTKQASPRHNYKQPRIIKLPKKLLTSEKVIETCLETQLVESNRPGRRGR